MDNWEKLKEECFKCERCSLCKTRQHLVFGDGNERAELMFVGEGPGEQEDIQGVPFVGPAGKLFDRMLQIMYLDRTKVYIANVVKCRPPRNRDPLNIEQAACREWLDRQIELVNPKFIVCLGRIAAQALIKDDFRITKEHGLWFRYKGKPIMAIYHPSALLRDNTKMPDTFGDLQAIRKELGLSAAGLKTDN